MAYKLQYKCVKFTNLAASLSELSYFELAKLVKKSFERK